MFAKDLNNLAQWLRAHSGLANYVHHNVLAMAGIAAIFLGNQNFMVDPRVFRNNEADTAFLEKASHRLTGPVFQNLNDHALASTAIVNPINPCRHAITMEHLAHLPSGEKQIRTAIIRHQKAETVFVANYPTGNQISFFDGEVGATPVADQLPIPTHGNQSPAKSLNALL
jgi:hypothetical protein